MGLFRLYSTNVEIQYKSYFLSKATLFTCVITVLNIILPFIVAYRSKGFWLKSDSFYEQPLVQFNYGYLLVAETEDPIRPIVCSGNGILDDNEIFEAERCSEIQVNEHDISGDNKNDVLEFTFHLVIPPDNTIKSLIIVLEFDLQLKTTCPLHMQSLGAINKEFLTAVSGFSFYGDLQLNQLAQLPCLWDDIDTVYNSSLLQGPKNSNENIVDFILGEYFKRKVTTQVTPLYSSIQNGNTEAMNIKINLRVPEMKIHYKPSLLQELKWAWPQYLSILIVFYWFFDKLKRFVFCNRLFMAWRVVP